MEKRLLGLLEAKGAFGLYLKGTCPRIGEGKLDITDSDGIPGENFLCAGEKGL